MHKKVMLLQDINLFKNNSIELEDEVIIMIAESFKALEGFSHDCALIDAAVEI